MTSKRKRPAPYEYTGKKLKAYQAGFWGGDMSEYFPVGFEQDAYDHGYVDGQKYGPRKGKPWTRADSLKGLAELKRKRKARR